MENKSILLDILNHVKNETDISKFLFSSKASRASLDADNDVSVKPIKNISELSIEDVINANLGIDFCLKTLQSNDFNGLDEYKMTACLFKWCIKITMLYLSQILPIKPTSYNENTFKTLFLDSALDNEYENMMTFSTNIVENEHNLSSDEVNAKYSKSEIRKKARNVLTNIKNKLLTIDNANDVELSLPAIDAIQCPIYISINMKSQMEKVVNQIVPDKILVISDTDVCKHYDLACMINSFVKDSNCEIFEYIVENSNKKTPSQMLDALMFAEEKRLTKASLIIIFGGGSVGSIGGMVAKLYFRGIKFIYVPTTLLSQIDCAIGCKHSVNGHFGKNKFGVYHLPEAVIINPLFIGTLSVDHKKSGLSEALKYGLCQSKTLMSKVINYNYTCFNIISIMDIITETIKCKLEYMKEDPYASSPELHMEFGHKIAHALEFLSEESMPHGICVAFGMVAEAKLFSIRFGEASDAISMVSYITDAVKKVVSNLELSCAYTSNEIADAVLYDNKRRKDAIPFIRLVSEQNPSVEWIAEDDVLMRQLEESIAFARECFS